MENTKRLAKEGIKQNYSGADYYDLIIIGSGVTGLSSGLMWLKNTRDKKTLILEKNPYPGGYITAFRRGAYVFETTQLFPDVVDILDYLGLDIKLKPYTGTFMRRLVVDGDEVDEYRIPVGPDNFTDYLCE
ncbi:MAG TPA: NAD(P)-binding protein, partial [Spirochaetota bacterium]|nr:NAD(P)-binding protein [Spirochaetota bacterium]